MLKYFRLCIACSVLVVFPCFATTQEESEHVKSAFLFSGRKQWNDALLHAGESNNKVLQTLMQWQYDLDPDSGASFAEISEFITKHPDWPEQKKLRIRAEMMLPDSGLSYEEIISWFSKDMPITGIGKLSLANSLRQNDKKNSPTIESLVREAWRDGDFAENQEQYLLEHYGSIISKKDDIERADRLAWEKKNSALERMFARLGSRQELYKARMALQAGKKNATKLMAKFPQEWRNDVGLLYDMLSYNRKRNNDVAVIKILLFAPKKVPYPEKWWKIREPMVRDVLSDGNSTLALKLLANHGQEEGQEFSQGYADANWLKGWLLLEYKQQAKEAYKIFAKLFSSVKYPVSKSRAAYWAARAAKKSGDTEGAKKWFTTASHYPTTFYGQVALATEYGKAPLNIPPSPKIDSHAQEEFNSRGIVRAVNLCMEYGELELAEKLINHLVEDADSSSEAMLASELGKKSGRTYLSVRGAKKAIRNNVVLLETGYPTPPTPNGIDVPRPLALAITRQESEFDNDAESPAGAIGLMQLLPSTAKEVAKKNDIAYSDWKLDEAEYNTTLGSLYLRQLLDNYDGSVPMAVAAYNAGPGNVYKWLQKSGKPANNVEAMLNWIESIPFSETRNYVQRVLENLQIYRYLESKKSGNKEDSKLLILDDLLVSP